MAQSGIVSLLQCPVCLDTFTDPRTLTPCLHTLCYKCLQDHITHTGKRGQFKCPQCRKSLLIPADGAGGFPKNFFVNSCIDVVVKPETGARSKTRPTASRGVKKNLCSNSEEGGDCGDRRMFCLECCEYYCNACSKMHRKLKATRSHVLVALKDLTDDMLRGAVSKSQAPRCLKHKDKLLELYCNTCQLAVCYLCSRTDHHSHTCKDVSDIDKGLKAEFNDAMASLKRLIRDSQKANVEMMQSQQVIEKSTASARNTTARMFQRIQQILTQKAKEVDQNIFKIQEEAMSRFGPLCKNQTLQTELLESLYTFIQDLMKTGTVYNRLASLPDVRSRLREFQSPVPTNRAAHVETPSSAALVAKQLDGLVLQEKFNFDGQDSAVPSMICTIRSKPIVELTILVYTKNGPIPDLVKATARAVTPTVDCGVKKTWETTLQPLRADNLQIDIIFCVGDDTRSVVKDYCLTKADTASRHLVLLHMSDGGSLTKTLQSLGGHKRPFKRLIQYDWGDVDSRSTAADSLAGYFCRVSQQSDDR